MTRIPFIKLLSYYSLYESNFLWPDRTKFRHLGDFVTFGIFLSDKSSRKSDYFFIGKSLVLNLTKYVWVYISVDFWSALGYLNIWSLWTQVHCFQIDKSSPTTHFWHLTTGGQCYDFLNIFAYWIGRKKYCPFWL
jgi:hypothetical protein